MDASLASHILDAIRDHMHLHVGCCQWTRDDGVSLWVCSARDNDGQRWVAQRHSQPAYANIGAKSGRNRPHRPLLPQVLPQSRGCIW